jgi:hypothetical protein
MKFHVDEKQERDWFRGKMTERSRLGRARRVSFRRKKGEGNKDSQGKNVFMKNTET